MRHTLLNKGQLQIQETILVVFIFVILLIVGMAFFLRFQNQSIEQANKDYLREKFNLMITTFPQTPEVKCSDYGQKQSCLDTTKLTAFSILSKDQNKFPELGFKTITIKAVYPKENQKLCNSRNALDCGVWQVYSKKPQNVETTLKTVTPVSLYTPETRSYSIGILTVEAYDL